jgi:aspartate racemase
MAKVGNVIGIVGGAGPYAGLDLLGRILDQTVASADQDHLDIISAFRPRHIPDRTSFLLGEVDLNPAYAIADQLLALERMGADVAGIPCNTAHAQPILEVVLQELSAAGSQIRFLNMIEEVVQFLSQHHAGIRRVGVLATEGTYRTRLYSGFLEPSGIEVIIPEEQFQSIVHQAIYDRDYGIKANGFATDQALKQLRAAADSLQQKGAEAVVLGCTEISLVVKEKTMGELIVIDPTLILARALIRDADQDKLKPLTL